MTRSQRRWHLFAWLLLAPLALAVVLAASAQRASSAGLATPELAEERR